MDVENKYLESSCADFNRKFLNYFDWNEVDVTYSRIDLSNNVVRTLSNQYEWILIFWDDDLDKKVEERLVSGVQYWNNYSDLFKKHYLKAIRVKLKWIFARNMAVFMKLFL